MHYILSVNLLYLCCVRQIAVIFLLFIHLLFSIGVAISTHYCAGKITSVKLSLLAEHKCPCGKKPMKKDCCKEEAKTFKIKNEQQKAYQFTLKIFQAFTSQPLFSNDCKSYNPQPLTLNRYLCFGHPPDNTKSPLYIQHRVFRI